MGIKFKEHTRLTIKKILEVEPCDLPEDLKKLELLTHTLQAGLLYGDKKDKKASKEALEKATVRSEILRPMFGLTGRLTVEIVNGTYRIIEFEEKPDKAGFLTKINGEYYMYKSLELVRGGRYDETTGNS